MSNDFLKRIERTPLTDLFGTGKNLKESVIEILKEYPQEQDGENFRRLLREVLLTESGVTGEELARDEMLQEVGIESKDSRQKCSEYFIEVISFCKSKRTSTSGISAFRRTSRGMNNRTCLFYFVP